MPMGDIIYKNNTVLGLDQRNVLKPVEEGGSMNYTLRGYNQNNNPYT